MIQLLLVRNLLLNSLFSLSCQSCTNSKYFLILNQPMNWNHRLLEIFKSMHRTLHQRSCKQILSRHCTRFSGPRKVEDIWIAVSNYQRPKLLLST